MDPQMRALLEPKKKVKTNGLEHRSRNQRSTGSALPKASSNGQQEPQPATSPTTQRTYDPRALLNPRGNKTSASTKRDLSSTNGHATKSMDLDTGSPTRALEESSKGGFALLENIHGTERRSDQRPSKRAKLDSQNGSEDEIAKSKSKTSSRRGNAGVGTYFKPQAGEDGSTSLSNLVDLTADDDDMGDEDFKITSVRNLKNDEKVCFGMLDGMILAYKVPKPAKAGTFQFTTGMWPSIKCSLTRRIERGTTIEITDPFGVVFGNIEENLAKALAPAMDGFVNFDTQPRVMTRAKKPEEFVHQPCSGRFRVIINVYGRRGDAQKIGKFFGHQNTWLRQPLMSDSDVPIENPHASRRNVITKPASRPVVSNIRTVEEAVDAVSKLFDNQFSQYTKGLPETEGPPVIMTSLLPHQKQALTFMLDREKERTYGSEEAENSSLWRKKFNQRGHPVFEEVVTGLQVTEEPDQVYGGLLADVMGLGKTIEALSLITSTMSEANSFGHARLTRLDDSETDLLTNSRATLVVAPVSTVKNWEDQITDHVKPGALKYQVFHGPNRERNPYKLANNDIVISTYSTIAAEFSGKYTTTTSPIRQIRWFRVMLDEAHTIRESKSMQAQAMYNIFASRRWCLTGTPIQNRMEDLASLTRFLKLFPYESIARFNQYVRGPAQAGDPSFLKSLRVFIDSFTLRRLRDCIDLPPKSDLIVTLEFSPEERRIHDFFRQKFSVTVQEMADSRKDRRRGVEYHRVLEGIMILRLICAHGKELLKEKQLADLKGMTADNAVDVDQEPIRPTITERKAYEHLSMMAEADIDLCAQCDKKISGESPQSESEDGNETVRAYVLPCLDVLCADCFSMYKEHFETHMDHAIASSCPIPGCGVTISPQYVPISKSIAEALETLPDDTIGEQENVFKRGHYSGPHTKTKQLLNEITQVKEDSLPLVAAGEPPLKCVVFSEFTSHLDLIERALDDAGHSYVRIDGTMSLPKRRKVLDELNTNNQVTILLASIKAAGQGLNLTAASRAYIMEPMWNPAAEAQAVDRIYRIGQKRTVIVKRFQMAESIEDKIVALQKKKQQMADISMDQEQIRKYSKKERSEQSWKEMIEVFKF